MQAVRNICFRVFKFSGKAWLTSLPCVQDLPADAPVVILLPGLTGGSHDTCASSLCSLPGTPCKGRTFPQQPACLGILHESMGGLETFCSLIQVCQAHGARRPPARAEGGGVQQPGDERWARHNAAILFGVIHRRHACRSSRGAAAVAALCSAGSRLVPGRCAPAPAMRRGS